MVLMKIKIILVGAILMSASFNTHAYCSDAWSAAKQSVYDQLDRPRGEFGGQVMEFLDSEQCDVNFIDDVHQCPYFSERSIEVAKTLMVEIEQLERAVSLSRRRVSAYMNCISQYERADTNSNRSLGRQLDAVVSNNYRQIKLMKRDIEAIADGKTYDEYTTFDGMSGATY